MLVDMKYGMILVEMKSMLDILMEMNIGMMIVVI